MKFIFSKMYFLTPHRNIEFVAFFIVFVETSALTLFHLKACPSQRGTADEQFYHSFTQHLLL